MVFEDELSLAFLDHRPVFPGHCLLIPKQHFETLTDLPEDLIGPFFKNVQLLSRAVESAMEAHGTFVAMNNRVSQSVPHLHTHIVPKYERPLRSCRNKNEVNRESAKLACSMVATHVGKQCSEYRL